MRIFRGLPSTLVLALWTATIATAVQAQSPSDGATAFITDLGERTVNYLANRNESREEQERWLREMLREGFAVQPISRFVIGRYARNATPEAIDEFVNVFEDYVVTFYASQFARYSGQTFSVQGVRPAKRPEDTVVIVRILSPKAGEPLNVEFHVRETAGTHKILDVRIEGISMVLAQRDEFTSYIANNGGRVEALTDALRERTAKITSAARD